MTSERLSRLLRWYPPAWRERYGEELLAYLEDSYGSGPLPLAARLSLVTGGLRERAQFTGLTGDRAARPERVKAGVLVVLCSWTAFVVGGSSFAKLSEHFDQAFPGGAPTHRVVDGVYTAVHVAAAVAGALVVLGAVIALPSFVGLLRSGGWATVKRHFLVASTCTVVTAGVTVPLLLWAHHLSAHQRNGGVVAYGVLFLVWGLLVTLTLAAWTTVAVAAARRVAFSRRLLAAEAGLAVAVAAAMLVIVVCTTLWWAVMAQRAPSFVQGGLRLFVTVGLMAVASFTAIWGASRASLLRTRTESGGI